MAQVKQFTFEGGRDSQAALAKAWAYAATEPNSVVLWLHGPQPVALAPPETLEHDTAHPERQTYPINLAIWLFKPHSV